MEATGNSQWFIERVQDLGHEIWIGDAAQIRASYVRKQKTDKRDAAHILKLVVEGRFPRLWTPDREQRDLRQLVLQIALLPVRGPQPRKAPFHHQLQNVGRVPLVRLLLAHVAGPDLCRIPDPDL